MTWSVQAREASAAARRKGGSTVAKHTAAAEAHRMAMTEHPHGSEVYLHHEKMARNHAELARLTAQTDALVAGRRALAGGRGGGVAVLDHAASTGAHAAARHDDGLVTLHQAPVAPSPRHAIPPPGTPRAAGAIPHRRMTIDQATPAQRAAADEGSRIAHLTGHTGAKELARTSRAYTNAKLGGTGGAALDHGALALHHGNEASRAMAEGRWADMAHHQGLAREHARAVLGARRGAR